MNDCGYRQTYLAKYVLFQDLDEFVVPTVAEDWRSMLDEVSADDVASYSFRNRFYPLEFPDVVDQVSVTSSDGHHRVQTTSKVAGQPAGSCKRGIRVRLSSPVVDRIGVENESGVQKATYWDTGSATTTPYCNK